ncbi:MAG: HlyD family efflux transporter periplasmic adaptor subunit [Methylovulum sp.]|jgi:putative peptide zinc metalloprotease protein|nr:HlyD family efflux transporter periplasmic adaptor subunit [Methylovulum sp.]MCF7998364.1 HlyD family efflux transporter periplasmic adaptor subunit [Methylovulum sp.]
MVSSELPNKPTVWPILREDLSLYPGPRSADGTPTWTLYDPCVHRYFRLGWLEFECLQRWGLAEAAAIAQSISQDTPITVQAEEVVQVLGFLVNHQLTKAQGVEASALLAKKQQATKPPFWTWLLHNYLFLRIPLIRPNRFLKQNLKWVRWMFSMPFVAVLVFAALIAIYLVAEQWSIFSHSFMYVFSPEGMLATAAMLSLSKVVHELGHAFTASYFGCRVPSMGVAFMLGFPMLWTDVTDAWRLPNRHQRLMIDAAGVAAELSLAVVATLFWAILPDGALRTGVYLLASSVWLLTLSINFNPFMRFDGYYLLSDWLDVANLQERAFALARWRLREVLFACELPPPEQWTKHQQRFLMGYAYGTWLYRLILFTGIAWMVYHFFFKALGVFLFAVEMGWFVVLPIIKEILSWRKIVASASQSLRPRWIWLVPMTALILLFIPWRSQVLLSGLLHTEAEFTLYSAEPAQVQQVLVQEGEKVQTGQLLVQLNSPDLDFSLATAERKLAEITQQLSSQSVNLDLAWHNPMDMEALQSAVAELQGLQERQKKLSLNATFDGYVRDLSDVLQVGEWLAKGEALGVVEAPNSTVVAFVEEADLGLMQLGAKGRFYPEGGDVATTPVQIITIDQTGTRQLSRAELASVYGGEIAAREDEQHHLIPEQAVYRVLLQTKAPLPNKTLSIRGRVSVETPPESLLKRLFRALVALLVRESSW